MELDSKYTFYAIIFLSGILWLFFTLRCSPVTRKRPVLDEPTEFNLNFNDEKWFKKLNFGAFFLTPIWLFSNGLWGFCLVYSLLYLIHPLLDFVLSMFLLFRGNAISWAGGYRWANDPELFLDEQYFWNMVSIALLSCCFLIGIFDYFENA